MKVKYPDILYKTKISPAPDERQKCHTNAQNHYVSPARAAYKTQHNFHLIDTLQFVLLLELPSRYFRTGLCTETTVAVSAIRGFECCHLSPSISINTEHESSWLNKWLESGENNNSAPIPHITQCFPPSHHELESLNHYCWFRIPFMDIKLQISLFVCRTGFNLGLTWSS